MTSRGLHHFSLVLAFCTLLLVVAGGLVTSHGVGMAVPDWPNTYGYNMFFFPISQWVGGIFYEHTHRLVASGVGFLTIVFALWSHGRAARRWMRWGGGGLLLAGFVSWIMFHRKADASVLLAAGSVSAAASLVWPNSKRCSAAIRRLGLLAVFLVILQGVLGGLRVVLYKDEIGILHAALAQLFFSLTCILALVTSPWWQRQTAEISDENTTIDRRPGRLRWWYYAGTVLILCQLIIGAAMRHQHAGLAVPDFPLAYNRVWPAMDADSVAKFNSRRFEVTESNPITSFQIRLHMTHRIVALAILGLVTVAAVSARRERNSRVMLRRSTALWFGLILVQATLGAATVWSNKAADIATAHVMVGALSLALGVILSIVSTQYSLAARENLVSTHAMEGRRTTLRPASRVARAI